MSNGEGTNGEDLYGFVEDLSLEHVGNWCPEEPRKFLLTLAVHMK
jgi:hypothetical protein